MKTAVVWAAVSSQVQTADDKVSMGEQETAGRAWAEANGYTVAAVLRVPGFSRSEADIVDALDGFRRQGVTAYDDLRAYWKRGGLDVLVAYNHSRLGRSSTLHAYVIENTIRAGASVYLIQGGWVQEDGYRFQIALGGVTATTDMDRLVKARRVALPARAARGLPSTGRVPWWMEAVRNERGRLTAVRPNEAARPIVDMIVDRYLAGQGLDSISHELQAAGVRAMSGGVLSVTVLRWILRSPAFWGHTAICRGVLRDNLGRWAWDVTVDPPDNIRVYRNTHEPFLTGERGERMAAELTRRNKRHRAYKAKTHRYGGLLLCMTCGNVMTYNAQTNAYQCRANKRRGYAIDCHKRPRSIPVATLDAWFVGLLYRVVELGEDDALRPPDRRDQLTTEADDAAGMVRSLEVQIAALIRRQVAAPDSLADMYSRELASLAAQRDDATKRERRARAMLQADAAQPHVTGLDAIRAAGLGRFWQLPNPRQNQLLHQVLGDSMVLVDQPHVYGLRVGR
jgi:hypothetical protein